MDFRARGISNKTYATLNEQIDRENELRLKWNLKYDNKLNTIKEPKISNVDNLDGSINWRTKLSDLENERYIKRNSFKVPEINLIQKKIDYKQEVNEYLIKLGVKDENSNTYRTKTMYEQDGNEISYLYNGISRDKEGRYKYLNERKKYKPDQKYIFPTTSSMEIGWKLYDNDLKLTPRLKYFKEQSTGIIYPTSLTEIPSPHAIRNVVINSFHRNNGVLSDNWKDDAIKAKNSY